MVDPRSPGLTEALASAAGDAQQVKQDALFMVDRNITWCMVICWLAQKRGAESQHGCWHLMDDCWAALATRSLLSTLLLFTRLLVLDAPNPRPALDFHLSRANLESLD